MHPDWNWTPKRARCGSVLRSALPFFLCLDLNSDHMSVTMNVIECQMTQLFRDVLVMLWLSRGIQADLKTWGTFVIERGVDWYLLHGYSST